MSDRRDFRKKSPEVSSRSSSTRNRALHVLSHMRRDHLSLAEASRLEHIKPSTVLRYAGTVLRQEKPGGRYHAFPHDKLRRELQVPTALGLTTVPIRGNKSATQVAKYLNAVGAYLRKGEEGQLKKFRGMKVGPKNQQIELITDPRTLSSLAEAGALRIDQLYASFAGA